MRNLKLLLFLSLAASGSVGQILKKDRLTATEVRENVLESFSGGNFEVSVSYTFYKDKSFKYDHVGPNTEFHSRGKWTKTGEIYILNSDIDSNNVPIELRFITDTYEIDSISAHHPYSKLIPNRTMFWIPLNEKNNSFPDARVFINNDSTYCFPYFDTCINGWEKIERIKIEFGNGFRSSWHTFPEKSFKKILCIAKVDVLFSEYISFKDRRFKATKQGIEQIN